MVPHAAHSRCRMLLSIAAGGLVVACPTETALAKGLFETFFEALGFRPAEVRPWVAPRPEHHTLRRRPPKARFVSLPPAQNAKQPAKPAAMSDAEIVAGILSDSTLRRGDIVIFPSGPRVFKGATSSSHKIPDFEDIRSSGFVADATRTKVLAITGFGAADMNVRVVKSSAGRARKGIRPRGWDAETVGSVLVDPGPR